MEIIKRLIVNGGRYKVLGRHGLDAEQGTIFIPEFSEDTLTLTYVEDIPDEDGDRDRMTTNLYFDDKKLELEEVECNNTASIMINPICMAKNVKITNNSSGNLSIGPFRKSHTYETAEMNLTGAGTIEIGIVTDRVICNVTGYGYATGFCLTGTDVDGIVVGGDDRCSHRWTARLDETVLWTTLRKERDMSFNT